MSPPASLRRTTQQTHQVLAIAAPHKTVQDGVDAAVEEGDANGEGHGGVDDFQDGTVLPRCQLSEQLHEVEHLMGHPAQEKGQDCRSQHAQHLVVPGTGRLLDVFRPQECTPNEAIASDDDDEWHKEAQQAFYNADDQKEDFQLLRVFFRGMQDGTHGGLRVFNVVDVPGQGSGNTEH